MYDTAPMTWLLVPRLRIYRISLANAPFGGMWPSCPIGLLLTVMWILCLSLAGDLPSFAVGYGVIRSEDTHDKAWFQPSKPGVPVLQGVA